MRDEKSNEIRTARNGLKVGERAILKGEPVAFVKQGQRTDTLSLDEFATALYGPGTKCVVIPGEKAAAY